MKKRVPKPYTMGKQLSSKPMRFAEGGRVPEALWNAHQERMGDDGGEPGRSAQESEENANPKVAMDRIIRRTSSYKDATDPSSNAYHAEEAGHGPTKVAAVRGRMNPYPRSYGK